MGILHSIFTWWNGGTLGTRLFSWRRGEQVGRDAQGNTYFRDRANPSKRWVMYNGPNDAARIAPEWWGWLHGTFDGLPDDVLPAPRAWEKPTAGNPTGTPQAYKPSGALDKLGDRAAATGDYTAWTPG